MKYESINVSVRNPQTGYIYIVDIRALERSYGWFLSAILLHEKPFIGDELKYPQVTSAVRFKIKSPLLQTQMLSIQQALTEGRRVHAKVLFHDLKLCKKASHDHIANTEANLLTFKRVVVEYRRSDSF